MNNVKQCREALRMTQRELLERLREVEPRMDIGTLSKIETGLCLPASEEVLTAMETALQANRSDLFDELAVFAVTGTKAPVGEITWLVADAVPEGKDNAVSRQDLARKLGVGDRTMRRWVELARADGLVIVNDQDGKGYYQPTTEEELKRQLKQSENRTRSQLRQEKFIRARLRDRRVTWDAASGS